MSPKEEAQSDGGGHFEAYSQHSAVLRTWLVAYGIGAPALFLSQDKIWQALAKSGQLPTIGFLFLSGVFLQVLLAAINKSVMWACYYGENEPSYKTTRRYRCASWLSERYSIDLTFDIGAMALFALATYLCFCVLTSHVGPQPFIQADAASRHGFTPALGRPGEIVEYLKIIFAALIVVIGWIVGHYFTSKRDLANSRRNARETCPPCEANGAGDRLRPAPRSNNCP